MGTETVVPHEPAACRRGRGGRVRREAEEDFGDGVLDQLRRRRHVGIGNRTVAEEETRSPGQFGSAHHSARVESGLHGVSSDWPMKIWAGPEIVGRHTKV